MGAVETVIERFLAEQERKLPIPELAGFILLLRQMLAAGGKRIRPLLCITGWRAVCPDPPSAAVLRAAASLELFHTFALIHDDVMDRSAVRRGRPAAHRALAAAHPGHPDPARLGVSAAILLGDLALGWSYELMHTPGLLAGRAQAARELLNTMRTETMIGQYLDLASTGCSGTDLEAAWRILRYKTARYTVAHPLRLGALLGGAGPAQLAVLARYGMLVGEAFQLRDDLLGALGNPALTGKPAIDDLREGKHTVLVCLALARADAAQGVLLRRHLGDADLTDEQADQLREVLTATGAVAEVEGMIAERWRKARAILDQAPLREEAGRVLSAIAPA